MVQPYSLKRNFSLSLVLLFAIAVYTCDAVNKYSKEANQPNPPASDVNSKDNLKDLEKPFRLAKINLIWAKAQKVTLNLYAQFEIAYCLMIFSIIKSEAHRSQTKESLLRIKSPG